MRPGVFLKRFLCLAILLILCLAMQPVAASSPASDPTSAVMAKVDPAVLKAFGGGRGSEFGASEMAATSNRATFIVLLRERADLSVAAKLGTTLAKRRAVYASLRETAQASQADLWRWLTAAKEAGTVADYRSYVVVNALAVTADEAALWAIAARPEVAQILPNRTYTLPAPAQREAWSLEGLPWNVAAVKADLVWNAYDVRGRGVVVANMDTGVDVFHEALYATYRGYREGGAEHDYHWYDVTGTYPTVPQDGHGHGTHTMGIMAGAGSDERHAIGVAPGARWIAVKVFSDKGQSSDAALLAGFEWILAPTDALGGAPDPAKAPDIVCNSWGNEVSSDTLYREAVRAWRAAGIVGVFAAGNEGPGEGTINAPASYPEALAVGSVDADGVLARSSARGPSPWDEIKPELVAPGVSILSAVPGGGYSRGWNGTSMAAPHVAGVTALLWEADRRYSVPSRATRQGAGLNPTLTVTETERLLMATASDLGDLGPDNDAGWGLVDAYQAVGALVAHGLFQGQVLDATDGAAIPGATVLFRHREHGGTVKARTGADGSYVLHLAEGMYDAQLSHPYYEPLAMPELPVVPGLATRLNFEMVPRPTGRVEGRVTDAGGKRSLAATITVVGHDIATATGSDGMYALDLPVGDYTLRVWPEEVGYQAVTTPILMVAQGGRIRHDVALPAAPKILLVNADVWRQRQMAPYFARSLQKLGLAYDVRDVVALSGDAPTVAELVPYDIVIWSQPKTSPGYIDGWRGLSGYLDAGGNLLITGEDIGYWDVERQYGIVYYASWLHADYVRDDVSTDRIEGMTDGLLTGLTFELNTADSAQNQRYPSEIRPRDALAQPLARYQGDGIGAVQVSACGYRALYFAFGLEGLSDAARLEVLRRGLDWLGKPKAAYGLSLHVSQPEGAGAPGGQVTYQATLLNVGEKADAAALRIVDAAWPVTISGADETKRVSLAPCALAGLTITVRIPAAAEIGTVQEITLQAVSEADPTRVITASLSTSAFPRWQAEAPLVLARSRLTAVGLAGRIYVVGGEGPEGMVDRLDVYDPTTGRWTIGASKPTPAGYMSAAALDGRVYVPGGYGEVALSVLEIYDPAADAWTVSAPLPAPRYGHAAAAFDGRLYVVGGFDGTRYVDTLWVYDPLQDIWTTLAPMPTARGYAAAAALDGRLYVMGGANDDEQDLSVVEVYDPATDTWEVGPTLPAGLMGPGAAAVGGDLYLVGGGYDTYAAEAYRLPVGGSRWQAMLSLAHGRRTLALAYACGSLYALGGWDGAYAGHNEALDLSHSLKRSVLIIDRAYAQPGDRLTYTLSLQNGVASALPASSFHFPIPADTHFVPGSLDGAGLYDPGQDAVRWAGALPASGRLTTTFQIEVAASAIPGQTVTGTVTIQDGLCGPYERQAVTRLALADLSASALRLQPEVAASGDLISCTIGLSNTSLVAASGLRLSCPLPPQTTYVEGSALGGATYDPIAKAITWEGTAPAGQPSLGTYRWSDSDGGDVTYQWLDATKGTALPGGDDEAHGPLVIGFPFIFYGEPYTEVYVNTNGLLTFGRGDNQYSNTPLPDPRSPSGLIAAFWDDLHCDDESIFYRQGGVAPNRYWVVAWHNVTRFRGEETYTFQIILYEGGGIQLQYAEMAGGKSATVGLEDPAGQRGLTYLYNGEPADRAVHDGLAIRFRPPEAVLPSLTTLGFQMRLEESVPRNTGLTSEAMLIDKLGRQWVFTDTVAVNTTDLVIAAFDGPFAKVAAGEIVSYTLSVRNHGTASAPARWSSVLPDRLGWLAGSMSGSGLAYGTFFYEADTRTLGWEGTVPPGAELAFGYGIQVDATFSDRQIITSTVDLVDVDRDRVTSREATIRVRVADLTPSWKQVSQREAYSDQVLTYTIRLANRARAPAYGVQVTDLLPSGLHLLPESLSEGMAYDAQSRSLTWTGTVSAATWDASRYVATDSASSDQVTYTWEDVTEVGVNLGLGDDDYKVITAPFPIMWYGQRYTRLAVGANGTLHVTDDYLGRSSVCPPGNNSYGVDTLLAVFWDDLDPYAHGGVYYAVLGEAPRRRLVVSWEDVGYGPGGVSFQAILYEDTPVILCQYRDLAVGDPALDDGAQAVVGIQRDGSQGLGYRCQGHPLAESLAVRFAPALIDGEVALRFRAQVVAGLAPETVLTNTAWIHHGSLTYTRTATTTVNLVDLSPSTKTVTSQIVAPGDRLTYTVTLRNEKLGSADDVEVVDALPVGLSYVSDTVTGGATYDAEQRRIVWQGTVPGQGAVPIHYAAKVEPGLADGAELVNTAWITFARGASGDVSSFRRSATVRVRAPDLEPSVKLVQPEMAVPGQVVTYTLRLQNTGSIGASASLTDALPAELIYAPDSLWASAGQATVEEGVIGWSGLVPEESLILIRYRARVRVVTSPGTIILNQMRIRPQMGRALVRQTALAVRPRPTNLPLIMR